MRLLPALKGLVLPGRGFRDVPAATRRRANWQEAARGLGRCPVGGTRNWAPDIGYEPLSMAQAKGQAGGSSPVGTKWVPAGD